jgi:transcriptional regulator with XRE-family HTH domain/predicted transcriptional regulator
VTGPQLDPRAVFGLKLRRLRESRHLTLSALAERAGLSTSYLAEIEAGQKYPKVEKIAHLADGLDCTYDELISTTLDPDLDDLRRWLASTGLLGFPFDRFGLPAADLTKLLTRRPHETVALIGVFQDLARQHDVDAASIVGAILRAHCELSGFHDDELEQLAEQVGRRLGSGGPGRGPTRDALRAFVEDNFVASIDAESLATRPALMSLFSACSGGPRSRLLLASRLTEAEQAFVLAREAGYGLLGPAPRSLTLPAETPVSFSVAQNDFRASYFAGALLVPRQRLARDLKRVFRGSTWQPEALIALADQYHVVPEVLMRRIAHVIAGQFGVPAHWTEVSLVDGDVRVTFSVEPSGGRRSLPVSRHEHLCRRWLATRLLTSIEASGRLTVPAPSPAVGAQLSTWPEASTDFFSLGMGVPRSLVTGGPIGLAIGAWVDDGLAKTIRFATPRALPRTVVGTTCERCALGRDQCAERVVPARGQDRAAAGDARRRELVALGVSGHPGIERLSPATTRDRPRSNGGSPRRRSPGLPR